ncbi:hypothetical protein ACFWUP_28955 [Nocardia sp. NPDC058658]|uniref:hypothetical protein n=1 Tax=Nocardia sp. NPDC058658 TaxID=3346580 RepID=UPI0036463F3A
MADRIGVVSALPSDNEGRRLLLLDGPLAGARRNAVNELGSRAIYYLPRPPAGDIPRPPQPALVYEVVTLGVDGKPAELRYVTDPTRTG